MVPNKSINKSLKANEFYFFRYVFPNFKVRLYFSCFTQGDFLI